MMPPFYEQIANTTHEYEATFARGFQLDALKKLANELDRVQTAISVKVSALSDGKDETFDEREYGFGVWIRTGPETVEKTAKYGYSAKGLFQAVMDVERHKSNGRKAWIWAVFGDVNDSFSQETYATFAKLAKTPKELAAWCREYMKEWE